MPGGPPSGDNEALLIIWENGAFFAGFIMGRIVYGWSIIKGPALDES